MNKYKVVVLIALLIMCSSLLSCSKQQEEYNNINIVIGTGGISGTYYPIGASMTAVISKYVDGVNASAISTDGSIENVELMKEGKVDLLLGAANSLYVAYNGLEPFNEPYKDLRGIAVLYPEVFQFIVLKDSGINTVYDLIGKRVAVGNLESGNRRTAKELLSIHSIEFDEIEPVYLSYRDGVIALKNGYVDCVILGAGIPTVAVVDGASEMDINILSLDMELFKDYERFNYLTPFTIPEGTYIGVNHDVMTVSSPALLATNVEMDEDIVYEITKALFEHLDEIRSTHPQGANIKLNNIYSGMSIPIHLGAEKYYRLNESGN